MVSMRRWTASRARARPRASAVLPVPGRPPMTINMLLMATIGFDQVQGICWANGAT